MAGCQYYSPHSPPPYGAHAGAPPAAPPWSNSLLIQLLLPRAVYPHTKASSLSPYQNTEQRFRSDQCPPCSASASFLWGGSRQCPSQHPQRASRAGGAARSAPGVGAHRPHTNNKSRSQPPQPSAAQRPARAGGGSWEGRRPRPSSALAQWVLLPDYLPYGEPGYERRQVWQRWCRRPPRCASNPAWTRPPSPPTAPALPTAPPQTPAPGTSPRYEAPARA